MKVVVVGFDREEGKRSQPKGARSKDRKVEEGRIKGEAKGWYKLGLKRKDRYWIGGLWWGTQMMNVVHELHPPLWCLKEYA